MDASEGDGRDDDGRNGQDNLKEDTKKQLALLGLSFDGDTSRNLLDSQECIEKRGHRKR